MAIVKEARFAIYSPFSKLNNKFNWFPTIFLFGEKKWQLCIFIWNLFPCYGYYNNIMLNMDLCVIWFIGSVDTAQCLNNWIIFADELSKEYTQSFSFDNCIKITLRKDISNK